MNAIFFGLILLTNKISYMQQTGYNVFLCALIAGGALIALKKPEYKKEEKKVISCAAMSKADTSLNGQWYLQPVLASDTAAGKYPTINFNIAKGTFTGHTGCNRMSGSFKRTDTSLVINENIMMTKMACPGYNEAAFKKALLSTNRYKKEDSVLILMFDQTELSRWTRKPYRAPVSKRT
jgi:heat shock protein HslJ